MSHIYDVIIVGAGPAGSSAASHLAKQGVDVLLLDKCPFPREKTCGDGLSPRSLHLLGEMDLLDEAVRLGRRCDTVRLMAPAGHTATIAYAQGGDKISYGLFLPRLILDELLLQHALACGAQFESPIRVTDIQTSKTGVEVISEYQRRSISFQAQMVIIAIGANSGLLVRMGLLRKTPRMALCAQAYFEGVTDVMEYAQWSFHGAFAPGYGWVFPLSESSVNVGAGFLPSKRGKHQMLRTAREAFETFIRTPQLQYLLTGAHQSGPVRGFPIRCDFARARTFGERVMLVGEAAGLVHPLTGEGISYALESGKLAAEHLVKMLETGDLSRKRLQGYDWQLRLRYHAFFTMYSLARSLPFLPHPMVFTHAIDYGVQGARLACHVPKARRLGFYALGAIPNTYPFSPLGLPRLKRRKREAEIPVFEEEGSATEEEVM